MKISKLVGEADSFLVPTGALAIVAFPSDKTAPGSLDWAQCDRPEGGSYFF